LKRRGLKRTRTRRSTARQRQQWRERKAAQRERGKNLLHPDIPWAKKRDPIGIVPTPLPRSVMDEIARDLRAEHGRDDKKISECEVRHGHC
jgi:hypothetical protein